MKHFKAIPGWAALTAGVLLASAVALAAPEATGNPEATATSEAGQKGKISELNADSVEYNVKTGQMTADGNVVVHYDGGVVTGKFATYNTKTHTGEMTGGVVADKEDTHLDCDRVEVLSQTKFVAIGNVHGRQKDKRAEGPLVEYDSGEEYARMPQGGLLASKDGTFTADYIEGWMKTEHARAVGNAHVISPPKDFEGGGDEAEYFGKESGKLVLTGHAWAVQGNNTLKSGRLTVFLSERDTAEMVADEKEQE